MKWWGGGLVLVGILVAGAWPSQAGVAPLPTASVHEAPRASGAYPLTPLLTGGIITSEREITLRQGIHRVEAEPWDGCSPWADGQVTVTEKSTVTSLVDLGYAKVPRAVPAPSTTILPQDSQVSGGLDFQGDAWDCRGDPPQPFIAQGGTCRHSFTSGMAGSLIQPYLHTLDSDPYQAGVSERVVAVPRYDLGLTCYMNDGDVPMVPGLYNLDYEGDARFGGAYLRPTAPAEKDVDWVRYDMGSSDRSCVYGGKWWLAQHGAGIYVWTGVSEDYSSDSTVSTCSSVRAGYAQSTVQRALVVNEVKVFQMTPSGDYAEVTPDQKFVDGNAVRIEMLIENRWKRDITTSVQLWDTEYARKLEPEKGQQNPATETFVAGAQKKVTFLWRTDGTAWETPGKPIASRQVGVMTPFGSARFTVQVAPRPALLLHGWRATASTWDAWPGFVSSVRSGWVVKAVTGMDTDPVHGVSIQGNARRLKTVIDEVRSQTGAVHVDLVAHSMGGLISRWYLSQIMPATTYDGRPLARSLTMFGTPNLGSDCANDVLNTVGGLRAASSLFGYSDVDISGGRYIPTIQLTPQYLTGDYRSRTPKRPGVFYGYTGGDGVPFFSCGIGDGDTGQEGDNDLVVVVPSLVGAGLGGSLIAPLNSTLHTSMGGSREYFDIAVNRVLGLGPYEAVHLVPPPRGGRSTVLAAPRDVVGTTSAAAVIRGAAGGKAYLTTSGGAAHVSVTAPAGITVEVKAPDGTSLGSQTSVGWPMAFTASSGAGRFSVEVSGAMPAGEFAAASLALDADPRRVVASVTRTGAVLSISARVLGLGSGPATVKAILDMGQPTERVITLSKKGTSYVGSFKVPAADALAVVVAARVGDQMRSVVLPTA